MDWYMLSLCVSALCICQFVHTRHELLGKIGLTLAVLAQILTWMLLIEFM